MNARTTVVAVGATLALVATAAQSAAGKAPSCGARAQARAVQSAVLGNGAFTIEPVRTLCGLGTPMIVAPNHFQVLRDSL